MTKSIMIVDDNPDILSLYRSLLKRRGFEVIDVLDGISALEMLDNTPVDLFVLDVMMPEMNGIELCQQIRALPQHKHTPLIVVSAYSDSETVGQMFAAGANDYLIKPIDPIELAVKAHEMLGMTQA